MTKKVDYSKESLSNLKALKKNLSKEVAFKNWLANCFSSLGFTSLILGLLLINMSTPVFVVMVSLGVIGLGSALGSKISSVNYDKELDKVNEYINQKSQEEITQITFEEIEQRLQSSNKTIVNNYSKNKANKTEQEIQNNNDNDLSV